MTEIISVGRGVISLSSLPLSLARACARKGEGKISSPLFLLSPSLSFPLATEIISVARSSPASLHLLSLSRFSSLLSLSLSLSLALALSRVGNKFRRREERGETLSPLHLSPRISSRRKWLPSRGEAFCPVSLFAGLQV